MEAARALHTATALVNGKVLIAGGYDQTMATLASAEIYDPITGRFSPTDTMGYGRVAAAATLLNDGRVLMVGGQDAKGIAMASVEIYDPITGTFADTGSMLTARPNHARRHGPDPDVQDANRGHHRGLGCVQRPVHGIIDRLRPQPVGLAARGRFGNRLVLMDQDRGVRDADVRVQHFGHDYHLRFRR